MRYTYEYKLEYIELYRQGKWQETPEGIKSTKGFHKKIRSWVRIEENCGPDALKHKKQNKVWFPEERYGLVADEPNHGHPPTDYRRRKALSRALLPHTPQLHRQLPLYRQSGTVRRNFDE